MHVSPSWLGCSTIQCTTTRYKVSISGASGSCICYMLRILGAGGGAEPCGPIEGYGLQSSVGQPAFALRYDPCTHT